MLALTKAWLIKRAWKMFWQRHNHQLRSETTSTHVMFTHHFKRVKSMVSVSWNCASRDSVVWPVIGAPCFDPVKWLRWTNVVQESPVGRVKCVKGGQKCLEGQLHLRRWAPFASAITGAAGMEVTPILQDSFSGWEGLLGTSFLGHGTNNGRSN